PKTAAKPGQSHGHWITFAAPLSKITSTGEGQRTLPLSYLIDCWTIARLWNWFTSGLCCFQPRGLSDFNFSQCFRRCFAKCRAVLQIRNVCNITFIFFAVKDVDVIVFRHVLLAHNL